MKIYDISQEVFSCKVYPGDPEPKKQTLCSTKKGDLYNLTSFSMCAHNGTHIDAPFHFLGEGKTVEQMDLSTFVGDCYLACHNGDVTSADAVAILQKAEGASRILIAGQATVTAEAVTVKDIALLEGVVLSDVPEGHYFLSAAPVNLAGADGAPCRAYLIEE